MDEDDLDLVAENTGVKRKERRLKRFRRASASPDGREDAPKKQKDLQNIFDDDEEEPVVSRRSGYYEDEEDEEDGLPSAGQALRAAADRKIRKEAQPAVAFVDEMEDFIDDDESDMEEDLSEEEREARREEKRQQRKADSEARRAKRGGGGFDPGRAGIDAEAWAELNDVFGDGSEYAFALKLDDDDDEQEEGNLSSRKKRAEFKDIFEPAAIKARMMTDEDDRIKRADFPERFQAALPGEEGLQLLERMLTSEELDECTQWVSRRFSYRSNRLFLVETGEYAMYREAWFKCVRTMVELIINHRREAMYLFTHRADDHELRIEDRGDGVLELLQRRDFSSLVSSCLKFKTLLQRRETLRLTFKRLSIEIDGQSISQEDRNIFEGMLRKTESTDEVADVADWLTMRFGQRIRDIQLANRGVESSTAITFKRPTVLGTYENLKSTLAFPFSSRYGISAVQLAENVTAGARIHLSRDESVTPTILADQYVDLTKGPTSIEGALEAARSLLAHEIGKNPTLKNLARKLFKEAGNISVQPTDRGHQKVDEEHPYYNFKFLKSKPVSQFHVLLPGDALPAPAQYLMILRAEEELLVEVTIKVDSQQALSFENSLYESYASDETSETSKLWNFERRTIISQALESFLIPAAKLWVREWLREECWEFIGRACEISLTKRIDCQPFQSTCMKKKKELSDESEVQNYGREDESDDEDDEDYDKREGLPKVLAVSHGNGDIRDSHVETIFLDAGGRLRARTEFESIARPAETPLDQPPPENQVVDPSQEFIQLLVNRRPDVIVVNGFSPRTMVLKQQIMECVAKAVEQIIEKKSIPEDQVELAQIDVIHCHDDVARIYQHSLRAAEEYPSFNTLARYCVALARYVQSPVQEFAALTEEDLLALRYDAYQQYIPRDRLLNFLERALIAVVNTSAVDINRAVVNAYYAQQLRYVSGLGPRKADYLMRAITSQLGSYVVNRDSLLIGAAGSEMLDKDMEILSSHVWHNACSFLIIRPRQGAGAVRKIQMQGKSDVLDSTRIHPESYDYARFIAFDALRKTEEDREDNQHPSAWCAELMEDPGRRIKVEDIDMADYERNLWKEMEKRGQKVERKLSLLEFIARELVEAMFELRNDFVLPNPDEVLTMLSGETKATFDTQRLVNVQVKLRARDFIKVILESGIEGTIHREYLLPDDEENMRANGQFREKFHDDARNLVKPQQLLKAQIIDIDVINVRAELTARESHVEDAKVADSERRRVAVDSRFFDVARAKIEKDQAEVRRVKKANASRGARFIRHPDFHNFKAGQAEEYLANMPRGTAVVRPSSKGNDHLAITWKVYDGVFQHIDVQELDKENEYELGRILRVGGAAGSSYSDLDELLVNHIAPMAAMVEKLINNEKFRGSEEELQSFLSNATMANPGKSQYGFSIDKKRPGVFTLGFKANRGAEVQRWPVRVLPGRYKLNEAELPDVVSLCNAFKTQYTTRLMTAARSGDKTPGSVLRSGYGGTTPAIMRAGGMAPMGARTPAPYGHQPGIHSLATPNPYQTSRPRPGPPPAFPGPPPARPPMMNNAPTQGIHPDRLAQLGHGQGHAPAPSGWD